MNKKLNKLAREIVEELVDCGAADLEPVQQYLAWTEKKLLTTLLADMEASQARAERLQALLDKSVQALQMAGERIDRAEKRLATPVRLTDERTLWAGEDDYDTGHVKGWNANRIEQAALLKKQGFTVEGDE
ncbi:hypothetical protein [Cedecea sp.]|uniref:hypothetical protein n=1 Tax=Cedecea sp. TaxID=1970739 RepID=UPI002F3E7403